MVRGMLTALCLFVTLPASAQQLSLEIHDGLVTLSATAVPVRQILSEWATVGGTRVVGGERITGAPLTLQLEAVPEAKALDIILRGAAGYVAAPRVVAGSGQSIYDRILVLASSTPPAASATAATGRPAGRVAGTAVEEPPVQDIADAADVVESPQDAMPMNPFAGAFAQPGAPAFGQPGAPAFGQPGQVVPFGQNGQANPFGQPMVPAPFGAPNGQQLFVPVQQAPQAAPQGVFGMPGSATPGMVQPVPDPQRPRPQG